MFSAKFHEETLLGMCVTARNALPVGDSSVFAESRLSS